MSKQYCFDINNPTGIEIDINELKNFVKNLYVGTNKDQFKLDELPLTVFYAKADNSICILMTSRGKKNIESVESINRKLKTKDLQLENGISFSKPYEFDVDASNWWGDTKPSIKSKRWTSLRQNGPYFKDLLEPYKPLGASLTYEGISYLLTPKEENIASFYAKRKISEEVGGVVDELTKDRVFNDNFWNDFNKYLTPEHKRVFKIFSKIGWENLITKIKENKKDPTEQEKLEKKTNNEEIKRYYGYAYIDGHREKVGNFIVEPQAIFYGRGQNPNRGRVKNKVVPEDVTINIGYQDPIPEPPAGYKWGEIVHDKDSVWLAKWKDSITGDTKYVMFSAEGRFKGEADLVKYEKSRKLEMHINTVRDKYMVDASSKNTIKMQLGTVLFLIDHFGVRVGNERKEDEADTVGASTLRVDHVKFKAPDHVIFDFLGKDSIRFYKDLKVPKLIYDNFKKLSQGKNKTEQVFHSISSRSINAYLKEFDKCFSAKVFRTRLASNIIYEALKSVHVKKNDTKSRIKILFNKANTKVADVLNHTRNVSKKAQDAVKKYKDQLKEVINEIKQQKKEGKSTKALQKRKESLKNRIESKTDVMAVAISTSLTNYIDPRLVVAWAKKSSADLTAVYTSALLRKFQWAIETTDKNWDWIDSPLIGNPELEPLEGEESAVQISGEDKPKKKSPRRRSKKKSPRRRSKKKSPRRRSKKKSPRRRSKKKSPRRRSKKKSPRRRSKKKSHRRRSKKKSHRRRSKKKSHRRRSKKKSHRRRSKKKSHSKKKSPRSHSKKVKIEKPPKYIPSVAPTPPLILPKSEPKFVTNKVLPTTNKHIGPGTLTDYKLLLNICKKPEEYKHKFINVPMTVLKWVYPFSKYAVNKGTNIKANEYIVNFYNAAYK